MCNLVNLALARERVRRLPAIVPVRLTALAHEVGLADELGERPRAHPGGQRLATGRGLEEGRLVRRRLAGRHHASLRARSCGARLRS